MTEEERALFAEQIAAGQAQNLERWARVLPATEYEDLVVASRSIDAMRSVIDSGHATVGEAAIFVVPRPPLDPSPIFAYTELSHAQTGRDRPTQPGVNPLQAGSAAHGDYSYAILTPEEPGIGAIGIYFLEGRLGLLYEPLRRDDPQPFSNVSVADFKRLVRERHGIPLGGIGIAAS
jgi:hypothetical protein